MWYENTNCIKIGRNLDLPYNMGSEGWAYNDNVNAPKIKKQLGEVISKEGEEKTHEETGFLLSIDRLAFIQERFYNINNIHHHEVVFFYLMMPDNIRIENGTCTDHQA